MIFQLIDNTSWASLLVNESKNWQRETRNVENESSSNSYSPNPIYSNKTIQLVTQEKGENRV